MTETTTDPKRTARQLAAAARAEDQAPADVDPTRCTAYGCPLRGSVDVGNTGRYQCHCHAHATIERWPAITQAIRQHDWMLRIIRDVKAATRVDRAPGIFRDNVYGWFAKVERGVYGLTEEGRSALSRYGGDFKG